MRIDGRRLRELRRRAGLTQAALAERSGIGRGTIQLIESGRTSAPRPDTLFVLAQTLGVTAGTLMVREAEGAEAQRRSVAEPRIDAAPSPAQPGPPVRFGKLPPPPPIFVGRHESVRALRAALSSAGGPPSDATVQRLVAVHGWPGVGKTTLAGWIARDAELEARFPDGVLWCTLGQTPDLSAELRSWCRTVGIPLHDADSATERELSERLTYLLRDRRVLIVIDDVWDAAHLEPLRVGGARSAMLVTTRQLRLADEIAAGGHVYRLGVLSDTHAFDLFSALAPDVALTHRTDCLELLHALENLPLAIHVAARLLRAEARRGFDPVDVLCELQRDARRVYQSPAPATVENASAPTIARLLSKSTELLDEGMRVRFAILGELASNPAVIDIAAVRAAWNEQDPRPTLAELVDRGLLELVEAGLYQMHAVLTLHAQSLRSDLEDTDGRFDRARVRLARHFAGLLAESQRDMESGDAARAIEMLDRHWINIERHLDWAAERASVSIECREIWSKQLAAMDLSFGRGGEDIQVRWFEAQLIAAETNGDMHLATNACIGLALATTNQHERVKEYGKYLEHAEKLAEASGDVRLQARAFLARAHALMHRGRIWSRHDAATLADLAERARALRAALGSEARTLRGRLVWIEVDALRLRGGDPAPALELLDEAESLAGAQSDPAFDIYITYLRLRMLRPVANDASREVLAQRMLEQSERTQSPLALRGAYAVLAALCLERGALDAGQVVVDKLRALDRESDRTGRSWDRLMRPLLEGRFADAECAMEELAAESRSQKVTELFIQSRLVLRKQVLAFLRGDVATYTALSELAGKLLPDEPRVVAKLALAAALNARSEAAREHMRQVDIERDWVDLEVGLGTLWDLAEAASEIKDQEMCARLYSELLPYSGRVLTNGFFAFTLGTADRTLGRLAMVLGDTQRAAVHLSAALALDDHMQARSWGALTAVDLAAAYLANGETALATELRDRALRDGRALGMARVVASADALLSASPAR